MKPAWLWIILFIAYAVFSIKTHAAESMSTANPALMEGESLLGLALPG